MRILIQGSGSIGQRHFRNARSLGHEAAFLRSRDAVTPFQETFFKERLNAGEEVRAYGSLEEACSDFAPDAAIIASPNHVHAAHAEAAIIAGLPTLIEKPAAVDSASARRLASLAMSGGIPCLIGYNLRFHPHLRALKKEIDSGSLGSLLSVSCEVGESIEDWHPWENYRDTYAPYVKSGGGSLLCFSHDVDYLLWLFGMPDRVAAGGGKLTPLDGDAEDLVQALFGFPRGLTALVHIDYWQRPKTRTLKVVGDRATILWSEHDRSLITWTHSTGARVERVLPISFDRNDMFIDEMKHFEAVVEKHQTPESSLHDSALVLEVIERMKTDILRSL